MHHEQVALDLEKVPIYRKEDTTVIFKRVSLCAISDRTIRIGCAHSSSNDNFEKILNELQKLIPETAQKISDFKKDFKETISKVYSLDHKKGQLEHDMAINKITSGKTKSLNSLSTNINHQHNILIDDLIRIKTEVEQLINKVLNNQC